jgi:hypothetical protein
MKKANTNLIVGVVAGALASRFVGSAVGGLLPSSVPPAFANIIPIAAGIYLSTNKSEFAKGAGYGMIAAGGSRFIGELVPAIGRGQFMPTQRFLGMPANQSILSMPANQSIMSGPHTNASYRNNIVEPKAA